MKIKFSRISTFFEKKREKKKRKKAHLQLQRCCCGKINNSIPYLERCPCSFGN